MFQNKKNVSGLYIQKLEHQLFLTVKIKRTPRKCSLSAKKWIDLSFRRKLLSQYNYPNNKSQNAQ